MKIDSLMSIGNGELQWLPYTKKFGAAFLLKNHNPLQFINDVVCGILVQKANLSFFAVIATRT
jgi:hypothetical protein